MGNSLVTSQVLSSASLSGAGIVKMGHLLKIFIPHLACSAQIRPNRLLLWLVDEVFASLPVALREFVVDCSLKEL